MFQVLFGISFSLQLATWLDRGRAPAARYLRRMGTLAAIGLAHFILIWDGDILLPYAIAGAVLYLFRDARQKTLLVWAASLMVALFVGLGILVSVAAASGRLGSSSGEIPDETTSVLARGTYLEVVSSRIGELGEFAAHILTAGPVIGALMLVGPWVQREGIVAAPHEHLPFLRRWTAIGLGAGLVVNATAAGRWADRRPSASPARRCSRWVARCSRPATWPG